MAQAWQTVEEAALTLGISVRTLHRRLASGQVQSRLENGRREVFVEISDPVVTEPSSAESDVFEGSSQTVSHSSASIHPDMHNTMLQLHEDRLRRTDLAILAYQQSVMTAAAEARRARIMARTAWGMVGVSLIALFGIGVWSTQKLTQAKSEVIGVQRELNLIQSDAASKKAEIENLRVQADDARLAAARAEGELKARKEPVRVAVENIPTTQPTQNQSSLVGRLLSSLSASD
ncbi:MAG: hypothetical protein IT448_01700 [Phycisphaerales bacterium]|nr:hypothetical protein [Phycisphaerales bacterium]